MSKTVYAWVLTDEDVVVNGGNFNHYSKLLKTGKIQHMQVLGLIDDYKIVASKSNPNKQTLAWVQIDGQIARTCDCSVGSVIAFVEAIERGASFEEAVEVLETIALSDRAERELGKHSVLKKRNDCVPKKIALIEQQPARVIELLNAYREMYESNGSYLIFDNSYLDKTDVSTIIGGLKQNANPAVMKMMAEYAKKLRG